MIYPAILHDELKKAGIIFEGCNSTGEVWTAGGARIQSRSDVATIIAAHQANVYDVDEFGRLKQTKETFLLPIHAPDFIVNSPKPKVNPAEALLEAIAESKKVDKSIALIILDVVKYLEDVDERLVKAKI